MAVTRVETQITWPTAAVTAPVTASGNKTSEEVTVDQTTRRATLGLKAEYTAGAPAADDILFVWILPNLGDPDADADSADEFATPPQAVGERGGAHLLSMLNVYEGETSGSGLKTLSQADISRYLPMKSFKLYAEGLSAGTTNTITVSAQMDEQRD